MLFVAQQGAIFYKMYLESQNHELSQARDHLFGLVSDLPEDSEGIARAIDKIRRMLMLYRSESARDTISAVIGELENAAALAKMKEKAAAEELAAKEALAQAQAEHERMVAEKAVADAEKLKRDAAQDAARSLQKAIRRVKLF